MRQLLFCDCNRIILCADSKCIYIAHGSLNNQWLCNAVIVMRSYHSSVSKEFTSSCTKLSEILYHCEPQTGKMGKLPRNEVGKQTPDLVAERTAQNFGKLPAYLLFPPISCCCSSYVKKECMSDEYRERRSRHIVGRLKIKLC